METEEKAAALVRPARRWRNWYYFTRRSPIECIGPGLMKSIHTSPSKEVAEQKAREKLLSVAEERARAKLLYIGANWISYLGAFPETK